MRVAPASTTAEAAGAATATGAGSAARSASVSSSLGVEVGSFLRLIEATNSFFAGQHGRVDLEHLVLLEQHDERALLVVEALAAQREDVVPAVGVERVGDQRRAQDFLDLHAASCRA